MSEEKKGHMKITVEVEMNEEMMEVAKNCMSTMPMMMGKFRKEHETKE